MNRFLKVIAFLSLFAFAGCGESASTSKPGSSPASVTSEEAPQVPAPSSIVFDSAEAGSLKGKVTFAGVPTPPKAISVKGNPECAALHEGGTILSEDLVVKDGNLQNAFVYVKQGLEGKTFAPSNQPVVVENLKCRYVPHVVGVQAGQPVTLVNGDDTLHNMHAYAKNNKSWNLGFPIKGMKQTKTFAEPEVMVTLKCDVHPWMIGYVGVVPHPFFAVTGEDGTFELKGLPPGEYVIEAVHEKLGAQSQTVRIEPRETKEIAFSYGP